jgi:hypothetical protein
VNLDTGERKEALFNPEQLKEKVSVSWNRLTVPGLSHQVLQFQNTGNRVLSGLDFYLDRFFANSQPGSPDIMDFRNFLLAFTAPSSPQTGALPVAPPRLLFVWPGVLTMQCVLNDVEFTYRQFSVNDGSVLIYTASVGLEQILDVRVTSEQLRGGV